MGAWACVPGVTATHSQPRSSRARTGSGSRVPGAGATKNTCVKAASRMALPPAVRRVARTLGPVRMPSPTWSWLRRSTVFHLLSPLLYQSALPLRVTTVAGSSLGCASALDAPTERRRRSSPGAAHVRTIMTCPPRAASLASRPAWRTLLEEGRDAFARVVGEGERGGREARDGLRQLVHRRGELGPRHHAAHQPHVARLARAHLLTGENHEHGALASHAAKDGSHHDQGQEADLDLGQPEGRIVGGDDDVAARGQATAAGERIAV